MKGQIVYTPSNIGSNKIAKQSLESFQKHSGWEVSLIEGVTVADFNDIVKGGKLRNDFNMKYATNGRMDMMRKGMDPVLQTKVACFYNHLYFWKKVVEANETMCFFEHDVICTADAEEYDFDEYLILNAGDAFTNQKFPVQKGIRNYPLPMREKYNRIDDDENYPLVYDKENQWKGSKMVPGTAAYAITPKGAQKMLDTFNQYGADQSDFIQNTYTVDVQYVNPSPVRFNTHYVTTSWGL